MATTVAPKQPPIWEDFIDIFVSPTQVFARRRGRGFIVPYLVLTVIFGALVVGTMPLMQPVLDVQWEQTAAQVQKKNPQVTADQLEKMHAMQEKFGAIGVIVAVPIMILLTGFVLWMVGKLFDSQQTMGDALMVSTYASYPKILGVVAGALILFFVDPSSITSIYSSTIGLGRFVDPAESPLLGALLGRVELFTIWTTVLLALGLSVTGKVPRAQAAIAAAIVWIVGTLPAVLGAMSQR